MQKLIENPQENLAKNVWEKYQATSYAKKPYSLTYIEFNHLAGFFLKLCQEQNLDYQAFDFSNIIDFKCNYEENKSAIAETIGTPAQNESEKEAYNKLKDYLTEEQLAKYTTEEKSIIEEIQQKNQNLTKQFNRIDKKMEAQENQGLDPQQIREEIKQIHADQAAILNRIEGLPNLDQQITALLQSNNFKDLGIALEPIKNIPQAEKHVNPKTPFKLSKLTAWFKTKQVKPLDALAGAFTLIIWLAASAWIIQAFTVTYACVIGLAVFWLFFIVAFRLMIGGIID